MRVKREIRVVAAVLRASVNRALSAVLLLLSFSLEAAPRRRAVGHPGAPTREAIVAAASRAAMRVQLAHDPRLHWENAVWLDGLVLFGAQLNAHTPGAGDRFLERAAQVLLQSNYKIDVIHWADGTAWTQAAPRDPWWVEGGYGARYWQDDLYMVVPWLALHGAQGNELARNLAYEWIEAYMYEHRDGAMATARARRGALLWDESFTLFQHQPESIGQTEYFWARGNGWALVALARAAALLDAPYTGARYEQVLGAEEMRRLLRASAASLLARRTPDGGWGAYLSKPSECPTAETSGTALLTFFLARGVNEGWLDRATYAPVAMNAMSLLIRRVDMQGHVSGIQPPDVGPGCGRIATNNERNVNVNYGAGALLLAASEVLQFPVFSKS